MLLSRLAEHVYWAGRYLERAEDTARLVKVQTELSLDLPTSHSMGWEPLLAVTGAGEAFAQRSSTLQGQPGHTTGASQEMQVVDFLTTSGENPGSVLSCLAAARLNLRSVRALLPRSGWERMNHLHLWASDTRAQAVPRRSRTQWTDEVIRNCQTLAGLLDGQMSHDQAYAFLMIGRLIERTDMTTRVLDVQATTLLHDAADPTNTYADVSWMAVLKSLSAMQMFRRVARVGVSGSRALNFLLTDEQFPRAVAHCLERLDRQFLRLPHHEPAIDAVAATRRRLDRAALNADLKAMAPEELHDFMDRLQTDIGEIHNCAAATWFSPVWDESMAEVDAPDETAQTGTSTDDRAHADGQSQTQTQGAGQPVA